MAFFTFDLATAVTTLKPLVLFMLGMVIYAVFIFKFYRFLAKKDIIEVDIHQYNTFAHPFLKKTFDGILYMIKYIFIFPILTFFWFAIFVVLIGFLSRTNQIQNVLLVAMALVGTIRVASYYNEDLSKDLAKMLPFALLAVFLIDISFFSIASTYETLLTISTHMQTIVYYFLFIVVLEFILRVWYALKPKKIEQESV